MTEQSAAPDVQPPRTFGFKDVFTTINVISGVVSIIFCIEGNVRFASYAFLLGWVLGDTLDGYVARKTNTSNQFGAQFDQVSDHLTQCIVPGCMVYVAYQPLSIWIAGALASVLVVSGSIRHARSAVASPTIKYAYIGMPRTVSALLVMAYLNSYYATMLPNWLWYGVPLILFVSVAHLLPIPFRTHKGRTIKLGVRVMIWSFFANMGIAALLAREILFDVVLIWLVFYSLFSWLELNRDELREFYAEAHRWAAEVRAAR